MDNKEIVLTNVVDYPALSLQEDYTDLLAMSEFKRMSKQKMTWQEVVVCLEYNLVYAAMQESIGIMANVVHNFPEVFGTIAALAPNNANTCTKEQRYRIIKVFMITRSLMYRKLKNTLYTRCNEDVSAFHRELSRILLRFIKKFDEDVVVGIPLFEKIESDFDIVVAKAALYYGFWKSSEGGQSCSHIISLERDDSLLFHKREYVRKILTLTIE